MGGNPKAARMQIMQIAVLGAGKMGSALARVWAQAGHQVAISSRRELGAMAPLVAELGHGIRAMINEDAIAWSEIIVLALPWIARTQIAGNVDRLSGKIVLDTMNAYGPFPQVLDLGATTSSEIVALDLPRIRVVKGLNTLQARDILSRGRPRGSPQRIAVPICGHDDAAKRIVAGLVDDVGFDTIDIGALPNGWWSEPERPLFGRSCSAQELMELFREIAVSGIRAYELRFAAGARAASLCDRE
jgi:predicted dinucleotide-binding enzyme